MKEELVKYIKKKCAKYKKETQECFFCNGTGYITRIVTGPQPTIDEKCSACNGTGRIDKFHIFNGWKETHENRRRKKE